MKVFCAFLAISPVVHGFVTAPRNRKQSSSLQAAQLLPSSAYDKIHAGEIAVIPNFLSPPIINDLREDAMGLHSQNYFSTDALASYGTSGKFDPTKDRAVLKLAQWKSRDIGSWSTRQAFGNIMASLRQDLSQNLNRPHLNEGLATTKYGQGSTEISYTRFGPGAFLKRHVDEHHEELKGKDGWSKPTRRSVSWLVYLNNDWKENNGGELRCFQRISPSMGEVGARPNGDLQIAWLRASSIDPVERPVFMDARRRSGDEHCAMYILDENGNPEYLTKDFNAHPLLYMAGGEELAKKLLLERRDLAERFYLIEPPKSVLGDLLARNTNQEKESIVEIPPEGGTLVLFDSVSLPHEVLSTIGRERWATSGWFHEDQQPEHKPLVV